MKPKLISIIIVGIIIVIIPGSHPAWNYDDTFVLDADADTTMPSSRDDIIEPPNPHVIFVFEKEIN